MKNLLVLFTFFFGFNLAFCQVGTEIPSIMFPNSDGTNSDLKELTSKESGYSIVFIGSPWDRLSIRKMKEITSVYDNYKSLYDIKVIYIVVVGESDPVRSFNRLRSLNLRTGDEKRIWRKEFITLFDKKSQYYPLIPGYPSIPGHKKGFPWTYVVDSESFIQKIIEIGPPTLKLKEELTEYFKNIKQE